jgi:hypothetical protein
MHSVDRVPKYAAGRPGYAAKDSVRTRSPKRIAAHRIDRRTHQFGPVAADAPMPMAVWIASAIIVFLLSFAAIRWLPDLAGSGPDLVSEPSPGTSTSTSAVTTQSLQQPDDDRSVTPNPVIPIIIRRSTLTNEQVLDLPPPTEISPPLVTDPSVDTVTTPEQLDLGELENAKRVQQRLIDLGFLFGAADGVWGPHSRQALQDFRVANGIGDGDTWDEVTQERLLTASDANAATTSGVSFVGGWGVDVAQCRDSRVTITARRAKVAGAGCEFHSTQRERSNVWRLQARCANDSERWNANIRITLSGSKLIWSSERGTTTYVRCPS